MKTLLKVGLQVFGLLLLALGFSAAANFLRPHPLPWRGEWAKHVEHRAWQAAVRMVGPATVRQASETGAAKLLDARPVVDYCAGHIPRAQSLPFEFATEMLATMQLDLARDQPLITYCARPDCDEGLELAMFLRRAGFTNVVLFAGGLSEWCAAGGRVEATP